jgi:hypothetical protein
MASSAERHWLLQLQTHQLHRVWGRGRNRLWDRFFLCSESRACGKFMDIVVCGPLPSNGCVTRLQYDRRYYGSTLWTSRFSGNERTSSDRRGVFGAVPAEGIWRDKEINSKSCYDWRSVSQYIQEPDPPGWGSLKNRDKKIFSWVPFDSDLGKAALAMPRKNWKLQTRLLIREGAPHQQTRDCLKLIKERKIKIGRGSRMGAWHQDRLADWPSVVI